MAIFNRLGTISANLAGRVPLVKPVVRTLYTRSIYPYPGFYFDTVVHPRSIEYRENFISITERQDRLSKYGFMLIWAFFFYKLFDDPGALFGHITPPDPSKWTDEELGIPPLEEGSYSEWIKKKLSEECEK